MGDDIDLVFGIILAIALGFLLVFIISVEPEIRRVELMQPVVSDSGLEVVELVSNKRGLSYDVAQRLIEPYKEQYNYFYVTSNGNIIGIRVRKGE